MILMIQKVEKDVTVNSLWLLSYAAHNSRPWAFSWWIWFMMGIDLLCVAVNCGLHPSVAGCVEMKTWADFWEKGHFLCRLRCSYKTKCHGSDSSWHLGSPCNKVWYDKVLTKYLSFCLLHWNMRIPCSGKVFLEPQEYLVAWSPRWTGLRSSLFHPQHPQALFWNEDRIEFQSCSPAPSLKLLLAVCVFF